MPLIDRLKSPPGGFPFRQPEINWTSPADGAVFSERVKQIQRARLNNPTSGLDPSLEGCSDSLDLYTCTRLKNDRKWCVAPEDPVAKAAVAARASSGCVGCGTPRRSRATSKPASEALAHIGA